MTDVPTDETPTETEPKTISEGYFEEEFYVNAADAGAFLIDLGEQLQNQEEITISGDDWELPFTFADTVTLDIEFEGDDDPELEIEVELDARRDDDTPHLA